MSTDFKTVIDELWSVFEEIGIEDGYDIVAQVTLLLAIRRLDVLHTTAEKKANITGLPIEEAIFDSETDELRWSKIKNFAPDAMFTMFESKVIQFLRGRGGTFADAVFTIPSPSALNRLIALVDRMPFSSPEANGSAYEYLISKITTKNSSGGFPTPRHLIDLMVGLTIPQATDLIVDPASGSGGFLVAVTRYLRKQRKELLLDHRSREHFARKLVHGVDNDPAFARMSTMNLLLHGVDEPDIARRDSLSSWGADVGTYSLVLTNPPFSGSIERSALDTSLHREVKSTTKAQLFVGRVLSLLQAGGRAAVIVPEGVLFGTRKAQIALRKTLVEDHKLDAVIRVPQATYQPFSSTQTSILIFTKTGVGGTTHVWFYDIRADGLSLDKRRTPVEGNDLPDVLARWTTLGDVNSPEFARSRTDQSFCVPREEIAENDYLLTLDQYREVSEDITPTRLPGEILADIRALNTQIDQDLTKLEELLA